MPRGGGRGRRGGLTSRLSGRGGHLAAVAFLLLAAASCLAATGWLGAELRGPPVVTNLLLFGSAGTALLAGRAVRSRRFGRAVLSTVVAGALLRVGLAFTAPVNYDLASYGIVVAALERGDLVYAATIRYNYTPVWSWVLLGVTRLARVLSLSPVAGIRLLLGLGDALVAVSLYGVARARCRPRRAALVALAFWASPVAVAVCSVHGQFDSLAVGIYLVGLLWAARASGGDSAGAALLVGAAVAVKQVVLILVAAFLARARSVPKLFRDALLVVSPFVLLLLPYYLRAPEVVFDRVFRYASLYGLWGWYYLLRLGGGDLPFRPALVSYAALAAAGAVGFTAVRRGAEPLAAARLSALLFLALSPGFSIQMLVWPLALGPEPDEAPAATLYTLGGTVAYIGLIHFHEPLRIGLVLAWGAALVWAVPLARRLTRAAAPSVL